MLTTQVFRSQELEFRIEFLYAFFHSESWILYSEYPNSYLLTKNSSGLKGKKHRQKEKLLSFERMIVRVNMRKMGRGQLILVNHFNLLCNFYSACSKKKVDGLGFA